MVLREQLHYKHNDLIEYKAQVYNNSGLTVFKVSYTSQAFSNSTFTYEPVRYILKL